MNVFIFYSNEVFVCQNGIYELENTKIYHWISIKSFFVQISIQWQTLDKLFDFFDIESKSHEWDLFEKSQVL